MQMNLDVFFLWIRWKLPVDQNHIKNLFSIIHFKNFWTLKSKTNSRVVRDFLIYDPEILHPHVDNKKISLPIKTNDF